MRTHLHSALKKVVPTAIASAVVAWVPAASANLLDLVTAADEGSWLRVNQNSISSVWTPSDLRNDYTVQGDQMNRIIYAWSSFAWDTKRSDLIIYGGGHANYSGNDVYTFNGSTLMWERSSLPSKVVPQTVWGYTYGFPADGAMNAPASAHTYDNTVYLRASDRYLTFGGASWNNGGVYMKSNGNGTFSPTGPYVFDPNKADGNKVGGTTGSGVNPATLGGQMWQNRDALSSSNTSSPIKPKSFVDGFSDTTVVNGKDVVYVGGAQDGTAMDLYRYTINDIKNPSKDTWELVGTNWNTLSTGDSAGALDPNSNVFVRTGDATHPFLMWDVSKSGASNLDMVISPINISGEAAPTNFRGYGFAYDPVRDRFVLWKGLDDVWALTAPEGAATNVGWTLSHLTVTGGKLPGALDTEQVLGKWQYAADLDAFVALQGPNTGDVWIYKPTGWQNPAVPVPEPGTWALFSAGLLMVGRLAARRARTTH